MAEGASVGLRSVRGVGTCGEQRERELVGRERVVEVLRQEEEESRLREESHASPGRGMEAVVCGWVGRGLVGGRAGAGRGSQSNGTMTSLAGAGGGDALASRGC